MTMDLAVVTAIVAGGVTIIGALTTGIVTVVRSVQGTQRVVVSSAVAQQRRSRIRDKKLEEIHLLVNSRLLTVLRLLVVVTRKEAERTTNADDVQAYHDALKELARAEASATTAAAIVTHSEEDEHAAEDAEAALAELLARVVERRRTEPA